MTQSSSLRNNLVIFEYFLKYLGLRNISGVREILKHQKEGYDADGRSYFFNALKGYLKINENILEDYDENIISYLNHINKLRTDKINLKYYQYLAILFTEIFFDNFQNNPNFLEDLNSFSEDNNKFIFEKSDFSKLAYWMATGSGKTLIMHINYLQFHKYNKKLLDNIILITPSQNMSKQHLDELKKSNIPSKIFDSSNTSQELIQIIDIHKLTEEKKGQGVTVEVSSFEGNNLIFVDEGHKGFSGKKWKYLRDQISKIGFTFEYSATFDEAIPSQRDELMEEYSKAIIFDYSYHYFYYDGYGKEFKVMNLKESEYSQHKEQILLYNLLSYYQQIKFYNEQKDSIKTFYFEKPLWIFIGNTVTGGSSRPQKAIVSDLKYLLNFFNSFLTEKDTFVSKIEDILNDRDNILGNDGNLNSDNLFRFIKNFDINVLYQDIIKSVFNAEINQSLELLILDNAQGEVAIKLSNSNMYFGLIYIGDTNAFKRSIESTDNFIIREDKFSNSLFDTVNDESSEINILLGSKKFIEGWNSYRVSNMGLLNMGSTKGSQIIQLFGRGVRLRGYKNLMKRSEELINEGILDDSDVPNDIEVLETLNIFGIKADYVDTFREKLEDEGINEKTELIKLHIKKNEEFLKKKLYTMKIKEDADFDDPLILEFEDKLSLVKLDLRPKISSFDSTQEESLSPEVEESHFPLYDYIELVDWEKIYFEIYDFKQQKGFYNLYISKKSLKEILRHENYKIVIDSTLKFQDFSIKIKFAESLCVRILRIYVQNFYNLHKRQWATANIEYSLLSEEDDNFQDYNFIIDKREERIIGNIQSLIDETNELYDRDQSEIHSLTFDKHLYQPLIAENRDFFTIPTGLNKGEVKFIKDLRKFFEDDEDDEGLLGYEFFIFRNLSRKGVGIFTETNNFYPDFILWAVNEEHQKIVFIDPKGLIHGVSEKMAKIGLNDILKELEGILGNDEISLSSYILSVTPFHELKSTYDWTKEEFEDRNVLFQEDPDYIAKLITHIIDD